MCSLGAEGYGDADEASLDTWFDEELGSRRLDRFGRDVVDGWPSISPRVKLSIKRAWRLTVHYFLGPQKQRERSLESGADHRATGDLSQYVAFLDAYLQKSFVEKGSMRLTFPYFVGPATWTWHHMIGERAAEWADADPEASAAVVGAFKEYFIRRAHIRRPCRPRYASLKPSAGGLFP